MSTPVLICISEEYLEPIDQDSGSSQMVLKVAKSKTKQSLKENSGRISFSVEANPHLSYERIFSFIVTCLCYR